MKQDRIKKKVQSWEFHFYKRAQKKSSDITLIQKISGSPKQGLQFDLLLKRPSKCKKKTNYQKALSTKILVSTPINEDLEKMEQRAFI